MHYDDFTIRVFGYRDGGYDVSVESPAGGARIHVELPHGLRESTEQLAQANRVVRGNGTRDAQLDYRPGASAAELGAALYGALFTGNVARMYNRSYASLNDPEAGLRIRLHLNLDDPEVAKLAQIPWEYVYEKESMEYLALSRQTPVVRYIDVGRRPNLLPFDGQLRILVVMSSPTGTHPLNLTKERQLIESTWAKEDNVSVDFLEHPTANTLLSQLVNNRYHVLHYMGHGAYDDASGSGALVLEDEHGAAKMLSAQTLGTWLRDAPSLRLAFLNACDTGRAGDEEPFSGVANRLIMAGLPAVVAMQFPISDSAAINFSRKFYQRLAAGYGVDEACTQGRKAILSSDQQTTEWGIPVLYMLTPDGRLFDTPVPSTGSQPGRQALIGGIAATLGIAAVGLGISFWPQTELDFKFESNPVELKIGDEASVVLAASNLEQSKLRLTDYYADVVFDDPERRAALIDVQSSGSGPLIASPYNNHWKLRFMAKDVGELDLTVRVGRTDNNSDLREYPAKIAISRNQQTERQFEDAVNNVGNSLQSTSSVLAKLKDISTQGLTEQQNTIHQTHVQNLSALAELRTLAISASDATTKTATVEKSSLRSDLQKFDRWASEFKAVRGVEPNPQQKEAGDALSARANVENLLDVTRRCLKSNPPKQLSDDLFIPGNGKAVFGHCYYLANGKGKGSASCDDFCRDLGRECDLEGLAVAARTVTDCQTIVKAIGEGGTFSEVKVKSGKYNDDLSGCTFGDWEKGNVINGIQQKKNRWIQVMRKDGGAPTCKATNGDSSRMRVCACKPKD